MARFAGRTLPYWQWPETDRALWESACDDGDVFDHGAASHLSPRSKATIVRQYARWLAYLGQHEPTALDERPGARITPARVKAYVTNVSDRCSAATVWNDVKALHDMVRFMEPGTDWTWLRRVKAAWERRMVPRRSIVIDSGRLAELGIGLMQDAVAHLHEPRLTAAQDFRDGLLIALLAYRPLRRRTLAGLTIGHQLQQVGETWMLVLAADDLKNRREAEFPWPSPLLPWLERFLREVRPKLPAAHRHQGLWPSTKGRPMTEQAIYDAVRKRTRTAFGVAVNLHAFRHSDATTIAMHAPQALSIAAPLLTHANAETTERYYNLANNLAAGRVQADVVDRLRQRATRQTLAPRRKRKTGRDSGQPGFP